MDITAISSLVDVFSKLGVNLAGAAVLGVGAYIWHRTGSMHMILTRLWHVFNGAQECKIKSINDFLEAQSAVLRFRFMTGIHARTLTHANKIISWSKKHDEDVADIAACGQYFDLEKPALNKPPASWSKALCFIVVLVLAIAMLISIAAMFSDRAILRMKDSGTVFTMGEKTALPFSLGDSKAIRFQDCPKISNMSDAGFTPSDIKHLCEWATTPNTTDYIATTVNGQRWVLLYLLGLIAYVWIPVYLLLRTMVAAKHMHGRLQGRRRHHC